MLRVTRQEFNYTWVHNFFLFESFFLSFYWLVLVLFLQTWKFICNHSVPLPPRLTILLVKLRSLNYSLMKLNGFSRKPLFSLSCKWTPRECTRSIFQRYPYLLECPTKAIDSLKYFREYDLSIIWHYYYWAVAHPHWVCAKSTTHFKSSKMKITGVRNEHWTPRPKPIFWSYVDSSLDII